MTDFVRAIVLKDNNFKISKYLFSWKDNEKKVLQIKVKKNKIVDVPLNLTFKWNQSVTIYYDEKNKHAITIPCCEFERLLNVSSEQQI